MELSMNPRSPALLSALILASGFAALVYQVLWVRELGLLFGSTAQSAAITIAAFFAGLGLGGWFWGRRSARAANPLRQFAWLELGVAITAAGYFIVLAGYLALYPSLHQTLAVMPGGDTLLKIARIGVSGAERRTSGGTGAAVDERNQTHIAMGLHPDPRRVFYLGPGTGITAGAVTRYPVAVIRHARHAYPPDATDQRIAVNAFSDYLGTLTYSRPFSDAPLNTDNNGLIEYHGPRTQRGTRNHEVSWVTHHRHSTGARS
jgi:hypothetical protein